MMTIMIMNMILSIMFMFLKHPISMGGILLLQTIIMSLMLGNFMMNFWFSYILFLVMVGGMLVLFIYMTSIASNEKFKTNFKLMTTFGLIMITLIWMESLNPAFISMNNSEFSTMESNLNFNQMIMKFMNWPSISIMLFLIMYLLFTLIAIVKITEISGGPLRSSN
uniref:NADH-ubiquinone oxidoreductase chain 6 n=1 Tax=Tenebrionoidea sp. 15 KM-2017 TaxID=2219470 RepID=A0A346RIL1_9CUCU|nr:NADH dehydrogenase subunit 6 [Tenebrionoidea sp. 15 KM-2017]